MTKRYTINKENVVEQISAEEVGFNGIATDNLQVLKSNAGYYIGSLYYDNELKMWLPYMRDSLEYYPHFDVAENALRNQNYKVKF